MKYDFTSIMDRHGKDAIAVDMIGNPDGFAPAAPLPGFDPIPMWVADMNFPVVPTIPAAMIERAQHPAYGYFMPTEEYFGSIIRWHEKRNGVTGLEAKHIGYENGVLGGVVTALNIFCSRGDKVLLHSPTYIGFTGSLTNNGYCIVHSPLVQDENGIWRMDYEDMERKIVENKIHAAVMCSPHNPTGRVWERWELEKAMELYRKHDVFVISDEIYAELTFGGKRHVSIASLPGMQERTVLVIRCTSGEAATAVRHIALRKRPPEGLLGGLYEFPCMEGHATPEEAGKYLTALGLTVGEITPLPPAKHLFSHIEWRMIGYAVEVAETAAAEDWFFADVSEVDETYAIPSAYSAYRPYCFA